MVLPMGDGGITLSFENPEHPVPEGQRPSADFTPITPEYFKTMQIPLLEGRDFTDRDDMEREQVMIVNRSFVDRFFPGEQVLGKRLKPGAGNRIKQGPPWREIVGVVADIRLDATQGEMRPAMYAPAAQLDNWCCLRTVVRSSVDPQSLTASIRQILSDLDNNIPLTQVQSMDDLMFRQLSHPRFTVVLLSAFAGLALVLTIVGLYGVMTYSVSRRTREIGVRMALGAQRRSMMRMVLRDAVILLIAGIAIGTVLSLATASVLQGMLYGTGPRDPRVIATVCAAIAFVGLLSAYIPARRATKIDPLVALRYE